MGVIHKVVYLGRGIGCRGIFPCFGDLYVIFRRSGFDGVCVYVCVNCVM